MVLSPWFDAIRNRLAFSPRRVPARRRRLGGSTLGTSARTTLMNSAVELLESRITPVTGTFAFAVPTNSVTENVVTQTIIVNLMTDVPLGAGDTMSVLVFETGTGSASPGGVDYTGLVANPTQVTFTGDGVAMAFITTIEVSVDIVEDALAEEDETIDFDLSNATASFIGDTAVIDGANDTHELTILDDDAVTGTFAFAVAAGSILENATPTYDITINLTTDFALRSGDSMSVDVTDLLTGTALLANFDYSAFGTATVTFTSADVNGAPVGTANTQTYTKTVSVTILEDLVIEGDETINFGLSNDGATNVLDATSIAAVNVGESVTHVATITDEDVGTVSITASDPSADEAVPADGEFTVTLGGGVTADDSIDVFYTITGTATAGGTDYTSNKRSLFGFPASGTGRNLSGRPGSAVEFLGLSVLHWVFDVGQSVMERVAAAGRSRCSCGESLAHSPGDSVNSAERHTSGRSTASAGSRRARGRSRGATSSRSDREVSPAR